MTAIDIFAVIVGAGVVGMNVWYWRTRARMTAEEKRMVDEQDRDDARFL